MRTAKLLASNSMDVNTVSTPVFNLDGRSHNIIQEVACTGVANLELRCRLNVLASDEGTEYGEKQNGSKVEVRTRYFF